MTATTANARSARFSPRRTSTSVVAVLFAAATALASFGLPSALTAWTTSGSELELRTHYVIWGALAGVYLPVAALALVRRSIVAPAQQLAVFVVAALACLGLAAEPENLLYVAAFTVPVVVLLLLHPDRFLLLSAERADRGILVLALVAAGPAVAYAIANARLSAATSHTDVLHGGYLQAAILAIALVLSTLVAAGGARGWQVTAAVVIVATLMLGSAGLLFPDDPSSVGQIGGAGCIVAAAALAVLSVRRHQELSTMRE